MEDALRHATAAHDWDRAVRLIEDVCSDLFKQDQLAHLRSWLEGLPPEVLERSPRLAFWLAWALGRMGHFADALHPLRIAERAWTAADDRPGLGLVLMWHTLRGLVIFDTARTVDYARRTLDLLPEDLRVERTIAALFLAIAHPYHGEPDEAEQAYASVRVKGETSTVPTLDRRAVWAVGDEMESSDG